VAKHMKAAVQEEAGAFNVNLKGNDGDIELQFDKLSDECISLLEMQGVQVQLVVLTASGVGLKARAFPPPM
jgi:hypothetical protein